jgi:hypothetical protein
MVNQYVHLGKIGSGSYGKVVRHIGCANNYFISSDRYLNSFYFAASKGSIQKRERWEAICSEGIAFCYSLVSIHIFLLMKPFHDKQAFNVVYSCLIMIVTSYTCFSLI